MLLYYMVRYSIRCVGSIPYNNGNGLLLITLYAYILYYHAALVRPVLDALYISYIIIMKSFCAITAVAPDNNCDLI